MPCSIPPPSRWRDLRRCRKSCARAELPSGPRSRGRRNKRSRRLPTVARYGAIWCQLTLSFCSVASERNGTMVNGIPVETVWMGRFSSSSETGTPSTLRNFGVRVHAPELRLRLAHLAEEQAVALLEPHRNLADLQVEHDFILAPSAGASTMRCRAWDVRRRAALRSP